MVIIDAYNVLHVTGVLPPALAGLDVPGLIRLLGRSRYAKRETTIVCDGGGSRGSGVKMARVNVLFSGSEAEADDVIETLIDRYARGRTLTVVSSDRRVVRAARKRRCEALPSDRFLEQLAEDARRRSSVGPPVFEGEIPLDRWSVAHWLREFGLDESPRDEPSHPGPANPPPMAAPPSTARPPKTESRPPRAGSQAQPLTSREIDPLLRAALEEWRGRLTLDDLDMARWIDDVTPTRPRSFGS